MRTPFFSDAIAGAHALAGETEEPAYVVFIVPCCEYAVCDAEGLNDEFRGCPIDYATED